MLAALALTCLLALAPSTATATAAPAKAKGPTVARAGVSVNALWDFTSQAQLGRALDLAKQSGAGLVWVDLGWSSLQQTSRNRYEGWYLDRIDRLVGAARRRGLQVAFKFWASPCWASSAPEDRRRGCQGDWWTPDRRVEFYPPRNTQDYGNALAFLVRRYGSKVTAWEVWNEPDLNKIFFRTLNPVGDYVRLLRSAHNAAKAASPNVRILAGATAGIDYNFVAALYRAGAGPYFDGIAVHPYSGRFSPLLRHLPKKMISPRIRTALPFGRLPKLRKLMVSKGDGAKQIWLTELGWTTCTDRTKRTYKCVTYGRQARYVREAWTRIRRWPWVAAAVYYGLRDNGSDRHPEIQNFGLLTRALKPKPAYNAFRKAALRLR